MFRRLLTAGRSEHEQAHYWLARQPTTSRRLIRVARRGGPRMSTTGQIGRCAGVLLCLLATALGWGMFPEVARAAGPINTAPPTISGTAQQGQVLTAHPGTWTDTASTPTISDRWDSCAGATCTPTGQTGATYTLTTADVGHTIRIVETATATDGTATATSAATGLVAGNAAPPAITGAVQEGLVLLLTKGIWTDSPTSVTDQWQSCSGATCTPVGTPNSLSYRPAATDVGRMIQVLETATNAVGTLTASSTAVGPVLPLSVPVNTAAPTISGTPQQGQTVTLTPGTWTNSPASITDQWAQCDPSGASCTPIAGQTGATYTLAAGDVGHTIAVVETASNDGGPGLAAISGRSAIVVATSVTSLTAFSTDAPMTNQTVTLVATVSSSSANANPSGSLTFFDGANGITGCNSKGVKGGQTVTVICQASFPAGTAIISAAYVPGAGALVTGSTSQPTAVAVGRDSTSVSLAVTKQVPLGKQATYIATLVLPGSNSGPVQPSGSIEFFDDGQPIQACLSQQMSNLMASCTIAYKSRGTHAISAAYGGDSNFTASSSSTRSVEIVKGSAAPSGFGFVRSTLQWTFYYHPTYTQVILLKVFGIANGTNVHLRCRGEGCPFHRAQIAGTGNRSIDLLPTFRHHRLRPGSQIIVRITHPHWVGKYYLFTIRGGRPPRINVACLAVGRTAPGAGC
jgi:Bacterial Ig-like domain (group 3)